MKRFVSVVLIMMMLMSALCVNAIAEDQIELNFWVTSERQAYYDAVIEEFQKVYPNVTITQTNYLTDDLQKNLLVAASSNTLPSFWYQYCGENAAFFPNNGLTYNLNDYAAEHDWNELFMEGILDLATFNGELAGYPQTLTTFNVMYRKDIFDKCGLEIPTTFEEFETTMEILKSNGYIPLAIGGLYGWYLSRVFDALLEMYAGSELHDQLKAFETDWNCEAVISAFAKIKEWVDKGYFPEGFITTAPNDARMLMYLGDAVMTIDGTPLIRVMIADGRDMSLYGQFDFPATAGAGGSRMQSYITVFQFNKNLTPEELDMAVKFVEFSMREDNAAFNGLKSYPLPYRENNMPEDYPLVPDQLEAVERLGMFLVVGNHIQQDINNRLIQADEFVVTGIMTPEEAAEYMSDSVAELRAQE